MIIVHWRSESSGDTEVYLVDEQKLSVHLREKLRAGFDVALPDGGDFMAIQEAMVPLNQATFPVSIEHIVTVYY